MANLTNPLVSIAPAPHGSLTAGPREQVDYRLSLHEAHLLKLLVEGHNYKTAAAETGRSIHTISFHLRGVYKKLQVHSKSEAVAKALRAGIIR